MTIIAIDPTYKEKTKKMGQYGKWLLDMHRRGGDLSDTQEINHQLQMYNDIKNRLPVDKKDIGRFKTIDAFFDFVHTTDVVDKTEFQVKAEEVDGVKFIAKNDKFQIFQPTTYEASKYLRGDNATCTGRHDSSNYYDTYTKDEGALYIY